MPTLTDIAPYALTVEQVARLLQVSEEQVRIWLRDGALKGTKLGGFIWRVHPADLDAFAFGNLPNDK